MSIQLTIPEMATVLKAAGHPLAPSIEAMLLATAEALAQVILTLVPGLEHNPEGVELWAGDITAGFSGDGPIPELLQGYDDEGWEE